jgi:hypothetical protein
MLENVASVSKSTLKDIAQRVRLLNVRDPRILYYGDLQLPALFKRGVIFCWWGVNSISFKGLHLPLNEQ